MKRIISLCTVLILLLTMSACGSTSEGSSETQGEVANTHNPADLVNDWQVALQYLLDGNERFVSDHTITRDTNVGDREALVDGQQPFAVIVTCSDSRVSPEIYFDQKLGDIFVIRNAGNIADETVLGSIEYAVEHLNTPLVVVVGHSGCGAVTGAFTGGEYPHNLQSIIDEISSSIEGCNDIDDAIHANIVSVVEQISDDEIIQEMGTTVLGAYYDIESGEILWD